MNKVIATLMVVSALMVGGCSPSTEESGSSGNRATTLSKESDDQYTPKLPLAERVNMDLEQIKKEQQQLAAMLDKLEEKQ